MRVIDVRSFNIPSDENDYDELVAFADTMASIEQFEAIPKADYEARLKADMVDILTEILSEVEKNTVCWYCGRVDGKSDDVVLMETLQEIIQEKINKLKGMEE